MYVDGVRGLFAAHGYVVSEFSIRPEVAQVKLRRDRRHAARCPDCEARMWSQRRTWQVARDLPFGPVEHVLVSYEVVQGWCFHCQRHRSVHPEWIDPRRRASERLMRLVMQMCRHMPATGAAELLKLDPERARRWDKHMLKQSLPEPDLDGVELLLVDEKSVRKGHGYVTLVLNAVSGELLHLAEGKKKASLEAFFAKLTDEQKQRIRAVAIDRSGAYREVLREHVPHADVVYDKFHILANYHSKVVDEVRRREWRKAKAEQKDVIKGQRYTLLKNPENRTEEDLQRLDELVQVNENLNLVDILKDDLRHLWTYKYPAWAAKWLHRWVRWAKETGIEPLKRFAKGLLRDQEEILNYCKHRITTAKLEAFNNTVSRIIHRACGVQDLEYLFLKARQQSLE